MKEQLLLTPKTRFPCVYYHARLDPMSLSPSSLEEECISVLLSGQKLLNGLKFLIEMWAVLTKPS